MRKAISYRRSDDRECPAPAATVTLDSHARHLRRRRLVLDDGNAMMVDLAEAVALADGDTLVLDDGSEVCVRAASQALYVVAGRSAAHLAELAWHIGNRHLPAEIGESRIFIERDHVVRAMLEGLGATVEEAHEAFTPVRGAYHHSHYGAHDSHHTDHAAGD
ncbi:urease accessory protein UreE [Pararhizobium mangrovi]|uniref:Urease accessory protein UreE n=1 Tax=Pararhizobium mangrovi TaxID=2590452 RepID=A0A506U9N2_9HYPH|nr:urease accessory protein UreE [Pararhizobium mangrovi]TPW29289.1 urease accessory protein UreE [Pararhizobium mangrovi]